MRREFEGNQGIPEKLNDRGLGPITGSESYFDGRDRTVGVHTGENFVQFAVPPRDPEWRGAVAEALRGEMPNFKGDTVRAAGFLERVVDGIDHVEGIGAIDEIPRAIRVTAGDNPTGHVYGTRNPETGDSAIVVERQLLEDFAIAPEEQVIKINDHGTDIVTTAEDYFALQGVDAATAFAVENLYPDLAENDTRLPDIGEGPGYYAHELPFHGLDKKIEYAQEHGLDVTAASLGRTREAATHIRAEHGLPTGELDYATPLFERALSVLLPEEQESGPVMGSVVKPDGTVDNSRASVLIGIK